MTTYKFKSQGTILAHYWNCAGMKAIPAVKLEADTKKELLGKVGEMIKDVFASPVGAKYEKFTGAYLLICMEEYLVINGKNFTGYSYENEFYGELTEAEKAFLIENTMFKV